MVDKDNRTKTVGETHNIEGWTKSVDALDLDIVLNTSAGSPFLDEATSTRPCSG